MKKFLIIGGGAMGSAFTIPCLENKNDVVITEPYSKKFIKELSSKRKYHSALKMNLPKKLKFRKYSGDLLKEKFDLIVIALSLPGIDFIGKELKKNKINNGSYYFKGATFSGNAYFSKATFSSDADFSKATFSHDADFEKATFSRCANFSEATFSGYANFNEATFSGYANFHEATFSGNAHFSEATFNGDTDFIKATFSGDTHFSKTTFSGNTYFTNADFQSLSAFIETKATKSVPIFAGIKYRTAPIIEGFAVPWNKQNPNHNIESYRQLKKIAIDGAVIDKTVLVQYAQGIEHGL